MGLGSFCLEQGQFPGCCRSPSCCACLLRSFGALSSPLTALDRFSSFPFIPPSPLALKYKPLQFLYVRAIPRLFFAIFHMDVTDFNAVLSTSVPSLESVLGEDAAGQHNDGAHQHTFIQRHRICNHRHELSCKLSLKGDHDMTNVDPLAASHKPLC